MYKDVLGEDENMYEILKRQAKYYEENYLGKNTLVEELHLIVQKYNTKVAIVDGQNKYSYIELWKAIQKFAGGLLKLGLKSGDNVILQMPNSIDFVITFFALLKLGVRPVLMLPSHRAEEIKAVSKVALPKAYMGYKTYLGFDYEMMIEELKKDVRCIDKVIIKGATKSNIIEIDRLFQEEIESDYGNYRDIALFLLSGGTTGIPKLIPKTHMAYVYNAKMSGLRCGVSDESIYLAVLSIAHDYPLCCPGVLGTLLSGGTVVMCKTPGFDEAFDLIEQEGVTFTSLVPAIVSVWNEALELDEWNLESLEKILIGAAKIDVNTAREIMKKLKCKIQQGYGLGEGITCFTALDDQEEVCLSCQGKPISDGDEVRIVDDQGNEVPKGTYGELIERGPYTFLGYYRAPQLNEISFTEDGFFRTGDRAMLNNEGNIIIDGRIREQINKAGENVIASEIEYFLKNNPQIKDAAVIGIDDFELGEAICAFIIPVDRKLSKKEIASYFKMKGIAQYKIPDKIIYVKDFPHSNIGKVDKKLLKIIAKDRIEEGTI